MASWVSPNTVSLLALQVPAGHTVLASLAERLSAEQQALLLKQLEACLQSGTPLHASVAYGHPDGRTLWLGCEAVCTPAEGTAQALTGVVVEGSTPRADGSTRSYAYRGQNLPTSHTTLRHPRTRCPTGGGILSALP